MDILIVMAGFAFGVLLGALHGRILWREYERQLRQAQEDRLKQQQRREDQIRAQFKEG